MDNVIEKIKEAFMNKKRDIYEAISRDYKESNLQIQYNLLEGILENTSICSSEGNKTILAIYNGNIYIMLEIVIKSLMQGKNIILISNGEKSYTREKILSIIRDVLKENSKHFLVKEYTDVDLKNVLKKVELIDRIIYFGDKRKYRTLKQNTGIEIMYNGYGSINVYVDNEDEFENELIKIEEYAYLNNFFVYKFIDDIDDEIELINKDGTNDLCIILSGDESKINKFKLRVNSTNILINEVKFDLKHELPEELFEFIKHNPSN